VVLKSDNNRYFVHISDFILNVTCEVFIGAKLFRENVGKKEFTLFPEELGLLWRLNKKGRNT
jgi:hypothetical protein